MVFDGHLSPATVKLLHDSGYKVRGLSGVRTRADIRRKPAAKLPVNNRQGTAKTRAQQPG
jgi:hypothetical protein